MKTIIKGLALVFGTAITIAGTLLLVATFAPITDGVWFLIIGSVMLAIGAFAIATFLSNER